ncbi:MAG: hypothetical protein C0412_05165 [Flavobacterium sp.]|nr:hypothetical protein [Flavobacterium sp.]
MNSGMKTTRILFLLLLLVTACKENSINEPSNGRNEKSIKILYTNDEHGWMDASSTTGGAAGLMNLWKQNEGYTSTSACLILSGGDMWTGPAISTWFSGKSMTQVMNRMNYSAAVIGNHEFDFGLDKLLERKNESTFPFLSANIRNKTTGGYPDFCQPFVVKTVNGIKVGIIGLTSVTVPDIIFPKYLVNLNFISYEQALNEAVPQVRQQGAKIIIIISHMGSGEMQNLAPIAKRHGIKLIAGGHSHETIIDQLNGITIIESGSRLAGYTSVLLNYDTILDSLMSVTAVKKNNTGSSPDAEIKTVVNYWKGETDLALSGIIGYVNNEIGQNTDKMYNLITDSWLYNFPYADIAISNRGGVRQSLSAGNISLSSIVGIMPFENEVVELELSGSQVIAVVNSIKSASFFGGINTTNGYKLKNGNAINPAATYKVLTTDYYYSIVPLFQQYDATPTYTYINWRQPVINYLQYLNTTQANPLDNYLDSAPRQGSNIKLVYKQSISTYPGIMAAKYSRQRF